MKLMHLFKESLENMERMQMSKSPPVALIRIVKNEWLQLCNGTRDLFEVCPYLFLFL